MLSERVLTLSDVEDNAGPTAEPGGAKLRLCRSLIYPDGFKAHDDGVATSNCHVGAAPCSSRPLRPPPTSCSSAFVGHPLAVDPVRRRVCSAGPEGGAGGVNRPTNPIRCVHFMIFSTIRVV